MGHSDRTVLDLLHKHLGPDCTFYNFISIVMNCMYTTMSKSNIMSYVNNLFTFFLAGLLI